jgi:hypothetical protein
MVDEKLKKAAFKEGECVCFDLASSTPYLAAAGVICAVPRPLQPNPDHPPHLAAPGAFRPGRLLQLVLKALIEPMGTAAGWTPAQ